MNSPIKLTLHDIKIIFFAICIGSTSSFGIDMHLPSLPSMISAFHTTRHAMQLSITIYLLGMLIMQLLYGPLSDKLGRKPVILFGLVIAVIGSIMCALSQHIELFLIGRLVQGIGAAVGMGLGRSLISDVMSRQKMAVYGSYASVFLTAAIMIAPVIGGYLQHGFGWQANFIALTVFFGIATILVWFGLPETLHTRNDTPFSIKLLVGNYGVLLKSPVFLSFTLFSGLSLGTVMAYTTISPFLFQIQYHLSPVVYGWLGVMIGAANMIGKALNGSLVKRVDIHYGIWIGLIDFILLGLIMMILQWLHVINIGWLLALIFIATLGQGFIFSNAGAGALGAFRHIGGSAGALFGSLQYVIGFLVSAIIAALPYHGSNVLASSYLLLGLIGAVVMVLCTIYIARTAAANPTK